MVPKRVSSLYGQYLVLTGYEFQENLEDWGLITW